MKSCPYRNGDLIDIGEDERVVIDVGFGDAGRLRRRWLTGVRHQFARLVFVVDVEALGEHEFGALFVDQVHHLLALLLHQRRRGRPVAAPPDAAKENT